ncbi:MAG TPA: shikimate dehydrogenase [Terriglobales bacterium]|nr:shikimate dehydrogenase [Terriglobales bacterium]
MTSDSSTYGLRPIPQRLPRVCVAIFGSNPQEMVEKAESIAHDNPFIEFRLDYLSNPLQGLPKLKAFLSQHTYVQAVATCRRVASGGKFKGSLASQLEVLLKAAEAGSQYLDLDLQSAQSLKQADIERLRRRAGLVLSYHDFKSTRKINEIFEQMKVYPADIYKVVTTATSLSDNVAMMHFLEEQSSRHSLVGVCMGEQGIISRVIGVRAGSIFTFAAASPGEETAPGQIAAKTLRDVYRIDQVDAATKIYGVAGDPIQHSLSPAMMNAAFRRENLDSVYLALHAKKIDDLVNVIRGIPLHGVSITMPYKEAILEHLDNCEPLCQKIGACNTVIRGQDGKLYGFNTDVAGVVRPIEQRIHPKGAKILVLGAGGAARAAVFGLKERGAEVSILNRTPATAQKLARQAQAKTIRRDDLKKLSFDVIINATPVGMGGNGSLLNDKELNTRLVMDMVYNPVETRLLRMAREKGIAVISGVEMFVQQGARQFEIWTGKPAPIAEMQFVVVSELKARISAEPRREYPMEAGEKKPAPEKNAVASKKAVPARKKAAKR